MRAILFVAVLALAVAYAAAQTRPKLSETFHLVGVAHIRHNGSNYFGESRWVVDQPEGKALEDISFGGFHHLNIWDLARFDLKKNFWITSEDRKECHSKELTGKMPAVWDWLEKADFAHNRTEGGETFDVWRYHTGGVTLELAVPAKEPNRPVEFSRRSAHDHFRLYVQEFRTEKPHSSLFDVPKECAGRSTFEPVHIN